MEIMQVLFMRRPDTDAGSAPLARNDLLCFVTRRSDDPTAPPEAIVVDPNQTDPSAPQGYKVEIDCQDPMVPCDNIIITPVEGTGGPHIPPWAMELARGLNILVRLGERASAEAPIPSPLNKTNPVGDRPGDVAG